jgi:hypothetical protein
MEEQHALRFGRRRTHGGKEQQRCGDAGRNQPNSHPHDGRFGNRPPRRTARRRLGRAAGPSPSVVAMNVLHSDKHMGCGGLDRASAAPAGRFAI